ncbi:MAG: GNAT family N-acetyltransferase, partial [Clostridia bacterium]|nr:GNAT family N-acetyltransferase [Clostridia bacterium]
DEMIEENTESISNRLRDIFVLFCNDKLIGELHISYENENPVFAQKSKRAYLFAYRIHKDFQGKGFGKILLENTLKELEKQGYYEFTVGVEDNNIRARYIYEKYGFDTVISRQKESYQGDSYEYDLLLKY